MPWVGTSRPRGILHGLKAPFKLLHRLVCLQELNKFQALSESFDHTVALGHVLQGGGVPITQSNRGTTLVCWWCSQPWAPGQWGLMTPAVPQDSASMGRAGRTETPLWCSHGGGA